MSVTNAKEPFEAWMSRMRYPASAGPKQIGHNRALIRTQIIRAVGLVREYRLYAGVMPGIKRQ